MAESIKTYLVKETSLKNEFKIYSTAISRE
ncbi:hypothetical protein ACGCUQ_07170 [Eubacteriales bacterium KG127]